MSEFGKTAIYKVNIQKYKSILYNKNEISETQKKKKIPFDIETREIRA